MRRLRSSPLRPLRCNLHWAFVVLSSTNCACGMAATLWRAGCTKQPYCGSIPLKPQQWLVSRSKAVARSSALTPRPWANLLCACSLQASLSLRSTGTLPSQQIAEGDRFGGGALELTGWVQLIWLHPFVKSSTPRCCPLPLDMAHLTTSTHRTYLLQYFC